MVQLLSKANVLATEVGHHAVAFPTRSASRVLPGLEAPSADLHIGDRIAGIRTRIRRGVVVLEVAGRLSDVVHELDRAIELALAEGPRGVVCDLSGVLEGAEPGAVEMLATAGRHVLNWPGVPVAAACPDAQLRQALGAHALGRHVLVTDSLFSAIPAVLASPAVDVESVRLAPHPTAPRASRNFITRTLLDWQLNHVIPFASLVVSELVASSSINAGTHIDLSVARNLEALRLTVRDGGASLPGVRRSSSDLNGRGLTVVTGLARAFGVLPTANAGKVVWAVLDLRRPLRSPTRHRSLTR
ncbi:MAG: hypothetical protein QOF35_977 [Actinomycetota bacterium]|nr:hypothetical protein [Actinomycetota bacterium]